MKQKSTPKRKSNVKMVNKSLEVGKKLDAQLTVQKEVLPDRPASSTPADMLTMAIEKGCDIAQLEKLMDLYDRWQKTLAEQAAKVAKSEFIRAKSKFQSEVPIILKSTNVNQVSKDPTKRGANYNYAELGLIGESIKVPMDNNGLTYDWDINDKGSKIEVTCILSHIGGHEKRVTMEFELDTSGGKMGVHAKASTITYLQRYTLIAVLGLTTANKDDDGHAGIDENIDQRKWTNLPTPNEQEYNTIVRAVMKGDKTTDDACAAFAITPAQEKELREHEVKRYQL